MSRPVLPFRPVAGGALRQGRAHWGEIVWIPVAVIALLDTIPTAGLHHAALVTLIGLSAAWSLWHRRLAARRYARHGAQPIAAPRREADPYRIDATTDRLTGIANRPAFLDELERSLARVQDRSEEQLAVAGPAPVLIA